MSTVPYPPQRQLSVGEVLDLTFRIYRVTLVKCLAFATCGVIAGQLAGIYALTRGRNLAQGGSNPAAMLALMQDRTLVALYIVGLVLTLIFNAAVLLRQRAIITDGAVGGELTAALRRAPAIVGLVILIGLGLLACFVPVFVPAFVPALVSSGALRVLLILAGLAALVVLCYALVAISCAMTVLLVEDAGPAASLARSWRLTTGSFWRLSIIYTVALIILFALYMVIAAVAGFLAGVLAHGDVAMVTAVTEVIVIVLGALAAPFYGALALAVLADLKVRKEGADLAQRISATA
jgi:hypothetical protein